MNQNDSVEQHSPARSVLLHLLPGFLIGGFYFAVIPFFHQWGYPSLMALLCALIVVLIPVELGYLLYEGKKKNGRFSLQGVVLYRTSIPIWQYFLWGFVAICLDGAYLYVDEARGCLSTTESLWLGSGPGERLASGVFPGGTHRDLRDACNFWGGGRAHGGRVVFSGFSAATDGVCREVGAAVAQFFVWAISCMDAVDVPDADGGDVALDLCSAEAQLESRYRYSYPGEFGGCNCWSEFYHRDE